jgi:hypothetical protein
VFFVVDSGSQYQSWLQRELDIPNELIYYDDSGLQNAYNNATSARNDVILAFPGIYTLTSEIAWSKSNTHVIGVGAGLPVGDWATTTGIPLFTTATITQANVLNLTGERNSFRNILFENYGNNTACLQAVTVNGVGNSFYNCGMQGIMTANQRSVAAACSLNIAANGSYSYFEDCIIGQSEWETRTSSTQGHLRYTSTTSMVSFGHFNRCLFRSQAVTAGVPMIVIVTTGVGYLWRYTDCVMYNHWVNHTSKCDTVFRFLAGISTQTHLLENCVAQGYTEWQISDSGECVSSAMSHTYRGGGLALLPNAAAGS